MQPLWDAPRDDATYRAVRRPLRITDTKISWDSPTLGSLKRRATGDINCGLAVESLRLFAAALLVLAFGQSGADPGICFVSVFC